MPCLYCLAFGLTHRLGGSQMLKLLQKPQVAAVEAADVIKLMEHHRKPLHAKSGSKARINLGIVADIFEHVRINHAAAQHL